MLKHAIEWMQMGTTVVEGLLLVRVLSLKLHRMYAFITLYCVLNVLFDGVSWYLGWEAPETEKVFLYSLFFFAFLYPFAVWDVFEESKTQVAKLRRLQTVRLVSGLLITGLCSVVVGMSVDATDPNGNSTILAFMGVFLLTGSASASAAFLWFMRRLVRSQKITVSHNTMIWSVYFMVVLVLAIVDCLAELVRPFIPAVAADIVGLILLFLDLGLLAWCILRLKPVPTDVSSAREKASL